MSSDSPEIPIPESSRGPVHNGEGGDRSNLQNKQQALNSLCVSQTHPPLPAQRDAGALTEHGRWCACVDVFVCVCGCVCLGVLVVVWCVWCSVCLCLFMCVCVCMCVCVWVCV